MQFVPERQPFELEWDTVWDRLHSDLFRPDFYYHGLAKVTLMGFEPEVTINYPQEKSPLSPHFRGEHGLRRYPTGEERCIACKLCQSACPAHAITIETEPRADNAR